MTSDAATASTVGSEQGPARRATLLFVRMWAIAHILHLLIADRSALDTPWNMAVVALATVLILKPQSGRLLVAMLVAQLVEYAVEMPFSPDHWALVLFVNLAILTTMLVKHSTSLGTLQAAFPAARVILLIAYGAAALSKWNTSFLDPVTSCANAVAARLTFNQVPALTQTHLFNVGPAVTESLVLLLLLVPRTRQWGVVLGLSFHFVLSANPLMLVGDFTSTVYALFLLFLRPEAIGSTLDRLADVAARSAMVRDARRRPVITASLGFAALGFGGYVLGPVPVFTVYVLEQVYLVSLLVAAVLTVRRGHAGSAVGRIRLVHWPVLALTLLWALNPYLGLRTTGAFTMFSNLRTESPEPNHLFMPSFRVTDWQDEMVTLVSANYRDLQVGARDGLAVPMVALRRMAMSRPGLEVTGIVHGRTIVFGPEEGQTALPALPYWQYKLVLLRPVTTDDGPYCSAS